jgi:lysophospholipase L1-like esterase
LLIAIAALACVPAVLCVVLYRYTVRRYRDEQRVRMDPTGSTRFVPRNAELAPDSGDEIRIVLFGDSRISMWFPALEVQGAQIVNQGWSGETTAQAMLRLDRDVIALRPQIVVIEYGMNDLKGIGLFPEHESEITEACSGNLKWMVERLRARQITVVLLTVFPVGTVSLMRRPIWSDRTLVAIARTNRALLDLASPGVLVIDCDPALAERGRMRTRYALDDFHLTPHAYQALNKLLEPQICELVRTVKPRRSGP